MGAEGEAAPPSDRAIRFGPFCLLPASQLLLEGDAPVHIGVRALDLLILLVERAGEVVTKDELFARVWPGLTVEEGNLRTQIALLRKALREGRSGARYLMTVPGRGYRFVADVSRTETREPSVPHALSLRSATDLPIRLTVLIGRGGAVRDIVGRLNRNRFVTIIGAGGIGKTSVAMEVAEQTAASYGSGVCMVDCSSLRGTSLVAQKLASALGLEIARPDPTRGLVAHLRGKRMLIILDCCDRVVEDAAVLAENLLKGAAGVDILATTREPLRAEGEVVYRLPPLEIPPANEVTANEALTYPAVQLFVERVSASIGQFKLSDADAPVVTEICRRLDGIALAIELAAGRVDVLGVLGVASRLEDRVRLLTGGRRTALPRHQTLAATLDWSYDALSQSEQAALRRLSVFAGVFSLDAAQAVAAGVLAGTSDIPELVVSLVSKSLLNADVTTGIAQYRLLDTTRSYALNKLTESGEFDQTARHHARHILHSLEMAAEDAVMSSPVTAAPRMTSESKLVDEARMVMDWAFSANHDIESGIALAIACVPLWTDLSLNGECCRYVEQALQAGEAGFGPSDRREMQLLAALGGALVWTRGPGPEADAAFSKALRIAESLDDADYQIRVLWGLWSSHFNSGRIRMSLDTARKFHDTAINQGDIAAELVGDRSIGMSLFYLGEHVDSRHHAESMLRRYVRPRNRSHIIRFQFDPRIVARTLLSKLLWAQGFPDQAMAEVYSLIEEATAVGHAMSLALALAQGACTVTLLSGDFSAAEHYMNLLLNHTLEHALDLWHAWGTCFSAMLLIGRGDTKEGAQALETILGELPPGAFFAHYAGIHATLAEALGRLGAISRAHATIDAALERAERDDERWYMAEFIRVKGELIRLEDSPGAIRDAEAQFRRSLDCARQQQTLSWELRTSISLARLCREQGQIIEARNEVVPVLGQFTEGFQSADLKAAQAFLKSLS